MQDLDIQALINLVTLDLSNNKIPTISNAIYSPSSNSRLEYFSIENNSITDVPAQLALCPRLKVLLIAGNPQRTVRMNIVQQGSPKVLEFLKTRLPAVQSMPTTHSTEEASIEYGGVDPRMHMDRQCSTHSRTQINSTAQQQDGSGANDPRTAVVRDGEYIRSVDGAVLHRTVRDNRSSLKAHNIDSMKADMSQVTNASVFQPSHLQNRNQITYTHRTVPDNCDYSSQRRGNGSSSIQSILGGGGDPHEERRMIQHRGGVVVLDTKVNRWHLDKRY